MRVDYDAHLNVAVIEDAQHILRERRHGRRL
jgi:hypothetical protein